MRARHELSGFSADISSVVDDPFRALGFSPCTKKEKMKKDAYRHKLDGFSVKEHIYSSELGHHRRNYCSLDQTNRKCKPRRIKWWLVENDVFIEVIIDPIEEVCHG